MKRTRRATFALTLAVASLFPTLAAAQFPTTQPTRQPVFGKSPVSNDDSSALVQNPGNLAFLPASELRWSSLYLNEAARIPWQGHALALAFPIPLLNVSTGIRVDLLSPPRGGPGPLFDDDKLYQWVTWGLALRPSDSFGIGFSLQRSYSDMPLAHGLFSWSVGLTSRPSDHFGLAFIASDINAPTNEAGGRIARTYDIGVAIRPLRSRVVELGLDGKIIDSDTDAYWSPSATLGVDIPWLGRLRGGLSLQDPDDGLEQSEWLASASMSFYLNGSAGSMDLSAGSVFGGALGQSVSGRAHQNLVTEVAFKGYREPWGAAMPPFALRIRLEKTPSVREHVGLLRKLWQIAEREPSVGAVVLELRSTPAGSMAHVQELRDAIYMLRQAGKRVLCHLEDADGASLYLCSAADRILVNPAGGIRFAGLRARYFYYASLLDKVGVKADFVRIGAHKSAPEAFTRSSSSEVARDDKIDLLQQHEKHLTLGIAHGRKLTAPQVRERIAKGPFVAVEAKTAGLVDGYAFDDELEAEATKLVGMPVRLVDDERGPYAPRYNGANPGIALIYVDGDMIDGRSQTIPLIGMKLVGSYTIAESIRKARENPMIGAVVLRVETGGGSAMAADVIWRELERTSKVKPVVVSMGTAAASGGYYIASPGTRVFANPLTITGSIGIFYGKADVSELMRKLGVNVEVYKTAPRADAESIFRPFTDEEKTELKRKVWQFYDVFLQRVAEGRKLTKEQVDAVGQGRVWTGEQALAHKLVDELGGLRQALSAARKLARLPDHAPIQELPPIETTIVGRILGIEGISEPLPSHLQALPPGLMDMVRALGPFLVHPSDKPLARMELTSVE
ncbi:MAG TPA: signal peptide peptidase SppA [Polyangiaceae bacterium]|nr:signal peptide peptidase SppA [Polyangiaceae bacterium]